MSSSLRTRTPRCPGWLLLATLASSLLACRPAQGPCRSTADCLAHEVCVDDGCRSVCNSGSDCAGGRACVNGACVPGAGSPDRALPDAAGADLLAPDGNRADGAQVDSAVVDVATVDTAVIPDSTHADQALAPDLPAASDALSSPDQLAPADSGAGSDASAAVDVVSSTDATTAADSAVGQDRAGTPDVPLADQAVATDLGGGLDSGGLDAPTDSPCLGVTCQANASCVVVQGEGICRCDIEQCSGGYCRSASGCCDGADCGTGSWSCVVGYQCSCVGPLVDCSGNCRTANACGGCAALAGRPGDACGTCGSWACDGREAVVCSGDHAKVRYYHDGDSDGWGSPAFQDLCAESGNYKVTATGDCNDSDGTMYPLAPELCDGKDNDCDSGTSDGESCPGGKGFCCGTPLGCQTCCSAGQCGTGDLWACTGHECSCQGLLCGVGADAGCWQCCRDLDCGSATQWDCLGHSCEPTCGGLPC